MRTTPAAVITFTSFELILRYLHTIFPAKLVDKYQPGPQGNTSEKVSEQRVGMSVARSEDESVFKQQSGAPTWLYLFLTIILCKQDDDDEQLM